MVDEYTPPKDDFHALSRQKVTEKNTSVSFSMLPLDHPILLHKPGIKELKELRTKCVWMRTECNAWNYRFGPSCGLDSMDRLTRCKRVKE